MCTPLPVVVSLKASLVKSINLRVDGCLCTVVNLDNLRGRKAASAQPDHPSPKGPPADSPTHQPDRFLLFLVGRSPTVSLLHIARPENIA